MSVDNLVLDMFNFQHGLRLDIEAVSRNSQNKWFTSNLRFMTLILHKHVYFIPAGRTVKTLPSANPPESSEQF